MSLAQMIKEAAPELNASSSEAEEEKEEHPKVDGERDPDFSQVSPLRSYGSKQRDAATYISRTQYQLIVSKNNLQ